MTANLWSLLGLAVKQLSRHRIRSATVAGVSIGMFLYAAVETMQRSLNLMTESSDGIIRWSSIERTDSAQRLRDCRTVCRGHQENRRIVEVLPVQITSIIVGLARCHHLRGVPTDSLQATTRISKLYRDLMLPGRLEATRPWSEASSPREGDWSRAISSKRSELEFG